MLESNTSAQAPAQADTQTTAASETTSAASAASSQQATTTSTTPPPTVAPDQKLDATTAPDFSQLSLPEGSALTADHIQRFTAFAQKNGMSAEQAQAVIAEQSTILSQHIQAQQAQYAQEVQAWDQSLRSDKEIGGEHLTANLAAGRRALERFAPKELIDAIRESGHNSYPPLVKMLVKIGRAMGEDTVATGSGSGGKSEQDLLNERYPSMRKVS